MALEEKGYDKLQLTRVGDLATAELNKSKMNEYEPVIVEDSSNLIWKDSTGTIKSINNIITYDTIIDLQSVHIGTGHVVEVLGYYTKGDGAGHKRIIADTDDGSGVQVASGKWANLIYNSEVNISHLGAKGDGINDDTISIQSAITIGGTIIFPTEKIFKCSGSIYISKPIIVQGNLSTTIDATFRTDETQFDVVEFHNLEFKTTTTTGVNAPIAIILYNQNYIAIRGCYFENMKVYIRNNVSGLTTHGAYIENNRFICDFTGFDYEIQQEDCLSFGGYSNISIQNNHFEVVNVHRIIKLTSGLGDTPPLVANPSKGILISNNYFNGVTTSDKQMIDFFSGSHKFVFSDNFINIRGWGIVLENKTGYGYVDNNISLSYKIVNNHINTDGKGVHIQGGYGSISEITNSYDNCLISGNTLFCNALDPTIGKPISVRFLHSCVITENEIVNVVYATTANPAIEVLSCEKAIVSNNTIKNGHISFNFATSNSGGATFNSICKNISCVGNIITESNYFGSIIIRNSPSVLDNIETINISSNIINTMVDNSNVLSSIYLRDTICDRVILNGNIAKCLVEANEDPDLINTTFTKYLSTGNSWDIV